MERTDYDLIVAGAGPAGCAAAITAARAGARVMLLDQGHFPRHKVCGEFVSAESLELLDSLLGARRFSNHPQIAMSRLLMDGKCVSVPLVPPARSIPRYELDAELFQAAHSAGSHAVEGAAVYGVTRDAEVFKVTASTGTFTSRCVINATGRWSRLSSPTVPREKWIGIKCHYYEEQPSPSVDLYFFRGGYCGVQPVGAHAVNACAMVRSDAARTMEDVFPRNGQLFARARSWRPLFPPLTTAPLFFRKPETLHEGMLLAGDAAGFVDPFAGDGISLALHSGCLAAESLLTFLADKCSLDEACGNYSRAHQQRFAPVFRNAARLRKALSAPAWLKAILFTLAANKTFGHLMVRKTRVRTPAHVPADC